ncbi:MAG: 3-oxoacyl-ACP reductase FabG [Acidobacteriaceae bacterium]|nr:3-oxoacyl-ACP reductase FabG [Acidobacteriaceae bacterium]
MSKEATFETVNNGNANGACTLLGKVALVTGASRGIGHAIALELARRGADIAINYRTSQTDAEELGQQIAGLGRRYLLVQGHIGEPYEAREIVRRVLEEWGHIDILVNNAGITRDHSIRKLTDEEWHEVMKVNLDGTFYTTSAAIPKMIEQKYGRIINISSFSAEGGIIGQANYAASKGGMMAFTKVIALELAKYNVTANCVAPGFTATDMFSKVSPEIQDQIKSKIPMGRFATPEEIAKAAAFLAADADYITGETINVNGGIYFH